MPETQTAIFGPGASKIFTSQARFLVAVAGQRGGKTTTGSYWSYAQATKMRQEQTTKGVKTVPPAGIICAPTYDLLRHSTLLRFFEEFPMLQRYYHEYKREMKIPIAKVGGKPVISTVFTRSLEDPKMLRGIRAWWWWADEGDIAPEESWEILKGRISDHEDGKGLITSTLAINSWINRLIYQPMLSGKVTDTEIISWPSNDRPGFPQSEWDRIKATTDPIQFARDFEGKFSFETGLVYGDILKYGVIDCVPEGVTMLATFFSVDYGLNDPTVVMFVGYGSDKCWYVLNEHVAPMMDVTDINACISADIATLAPIYGMPLATYYDPAGGIAVLSLSNDVFPVAAVKDIPGRITLVRNFIFQHRVFVLSHNTHLMKELSLYSFLPDRPLPLDKHNHSSDAMGYVIHSAWGMVEGLEEEKKTAPTNRIAVDLENRGLLKDGIFQNILTEENNFIM